VSGNARVVWDSLASNQRVAMGLEFTALAGEDRSALTQYLTSFGVGATV
jgi:hypothetical protein